MLIITIFQILVIFFSKNFIMLLNFNFKKEHFSFKFKIRIKNNKIKAYIHPYRMKKFKCIKI